MSDTLTGLISRVVYLGGAWLYVIHETTDTLFGVRFVNTTSGTAEPEWASIPRADVGEAPIHHPLTIVSWWPEAISTFLVGTTGTAPRVSGDQDTGQAYARGVSDGRAERDRHHQAWLDSLVSDAHQFADDNSLCSEFDRFMEEHDLPTRSRDYRVVLSLSTTVSVSVSARSEDDAAEEAERIFRDFPRDYVDFSEVSVDVEDVEVE